MKFLRKILKGITSKVIFFILVIGVHLCIITALYSDYAHYIKEPSEKGISLTNTLKEPSPTDYTKTQDYGI